MPKRSKYVMVRLTEAEHKEITGFADRSGLPVSSALRLLARNQLRYIWYAEDRRNRGISKDRRVWRVGVRGSEIKRIVDAALEKDPLLTEEEITGIVLRESPRLAPARRRVQKAVGDLMSQASSRG